MKRDVNYWWKWIVNVSFAVHDSRDWSVMQLTNNIIRSFDHLSGVDSTPLDKTVHSLGMWSWPIDFHVTAWPNFSSSQYERRDTYARAGVNLCTNCSRHNAQFTFHREGFHQSERLRNTCSQLPTDVILCSERNRKWTLYFKPSA